MSAGRRDILGASLALAALAGCDGPDEWGQPRHARRAGVADEAASIASVLELDGLGRGVLVRTRAGHAVKVEGNPRHPASLGATDVFLEASVLSLHDPARSRAPPPDWREWRDAALLTGPVSSPTLKRLLAEWGGRWFVHDPMGEPGGAVPELRAASLVLCLGADPLGPGPAQLAHARAWRERRPALWVAEAAPSLSGLRADRRWAMAPAEVVQLARAVAARLGVAVTGEHPMAEELAEALRAAGPGALVLAGRGGPTGLAAAMNAALASRASRNVAPPLAVRPGLEELANAIRSGQVERLLVLDANPSFDAPGFAPLLRRVPHSLHLGVRRDETAADCTRHAALAHPLESWGDSLAFDGTPAIRQPVARTALPGPVEVALGLLGRAQPAREAVRDTWRAAWGEAVFEARWLAALEAGVAGEAGATLEATPLPLEEARARTSLTAVFAPDPQLRAGAFAHEAWLQELPRTITGLSWGNAALVHPATGLAPGDEVELSLGGTSLRAPALPLEGVAAGCVVLPLGFGRRAGGAGQGRGFDAGALRPAGAWHAAGLAMRPTGRRLALAHGPTHPALLGRGPVKAVAPGEALPPPPERASFHAPWTSGGAAWGMAIDLDACIGCNACALACQAENNVPVVGPEAMARGRGLHWLRVERHEDAFLPVPCMQCEKAPCEPVCPVNATVHDPEGLNAMVHARCIGTRTCANNCPYGVRRFNWEDHRRATDTPARNPDVSLRPRGVMEKCTYCSHRIQAARREGRLGAVETACQRACPTRAITFGDLNDGGSAVAAARRDGRHYLLLEETGTRPRTSYLARVARG